MKKSYLFIFCVLFTYNLSFGQAEKEKSQETDLMQQFKQMEEGMQDVFGNNGQMKILVDTIMSQDFNQLFDPNNFQQLDSDAMAQSFEEMFKIFEEQFNSFSKDDMQEFEELFEGFNLSEIITPQLDKEGNPIPPTEKEVKKKEKKRKTYKL